MLDNEVAAVVLEPHFDAVRDIFVEYELEPGVRLDKLKRTRFVVDPTVHDSERHYAMCRDDGSLIRIAPEAAELPLENLIAVLSHEFGHAADFTYPAKWVTPLRGAEQAQATWIGDRDDKPARKWRRLWAERSDDQVEWAADAIASTVTGIQIRYCGACMLQCFSGEQTRPEGLQ